MNNLGKKKTRFIMVPYFLFENYPELNIYDLMVYIVLLSFYPKIFPSMKTIAKLARTSKRTVVRSIKRLTEMNLIKVNKKFGISNYYTLGTRVQNNNEIMNLLYEARILKIRQKKNDQTNKTGAPQTPVAKTGAPQALG